MSTAESVWRALVTGEAIRSAQDRGDHERAAQLREALAKLEAVERNAVWLVNTGYEHPVSLIDARLGSRSLP